LKKKKTNFPSFDSVSSTLNYQGFANRRWNWGWRNRLYVWQQEQSSRIVITRTQSLSPQEVPYIEWFEMRVMRRSMWLVYE
jgi:hypothetical protein